MFPSFCARFIQIVTFAQLMLKMVFAKSMNLFQKSILYECNFQCTMLQIFSKFEDKAAGCGNFTICLLLRFYVKSNFAEFKRSKRSFLSRVSDSNIRIIENSNIFHYSRLDYFPENNRVFRLFRFFRKTAHFCS